MQQHITNLILEMIGENEENWTLDSQTAGYNHALNTLRQQVPDLVTKIMNLMEYGKK